MVVSDNGSGFASEEFADFMARNGILPVRRAPRHPSSNGLVDRSVRISRGDQEVGRIGRCGAHQT